MFTETTNDLSLYADLTNGGFNEFIGEMSFLGGVVLDLLDIDVGKFEIEDVLIPTTVAIHSTDPDYPGNTPSSSPLLSIEGQQGSDLVAREVHTIVTSVIPEEGIEIATVELDIQSACSRYHYAISRILRSRDNRSASYRRQNVERRMEWMDFLG